jgi:hypothetical protein
VFVGLATLLTIFIGSTSARDDLTTLASVVIDLGINPGAANVTILGAATDDHLSGSSQLGGIPSIDRARSIATGDFNSDGIQDVAVGAPDADVPDDPAPRVDAGAVYIIFGRLNFTSPTVIDTNPAALSHADVIIRGSSADPGTPDALGFAVAAGDVDGDGTDDLVVGAPGADFPGINPAPARDNTGAIFILRGSVSLASGTIIDLDQADAIDVAIYGVATGDRFGSSIAVANAGGTPSTPAAQQLTKDILIGAPASGTGSGAAYLIFGKPTLSRNVASTRVFDLAAAATPANVVILGDTGDGLGSSVDIGDVNGGGSRDLLVGAPLANRPSPSAAADTGAVYGIFGGTNLNPVGMNLSKTFDVGQSEENVEIFGVTTDDLAGVSVSVGDVNSDGIADILIGAPGADGPFDARSQAGEAYIVLGGSNLNPSVGTLQRVDIATGASLTMFGGLAGDHFGSTVKIGVFNMSGNTDTIPDVLVGAPDAAGGKGSLSGFFGGPTLLFLSTRDVGLLQDEVHVIGGSGGDGLGWAVATADIDNNSGGDLIVGAPFADVASRPDAGKVYVFLAASNAVPPVNLNPAVTVVSPNGGEALHGGSTFNITWTATDANGNDTIQRFEIRLSTDGGATFNTVISSNVAGNIRAFLWAVPIGLNTSTARIRVIAFDDAGGQGQDNSNLNFSITDAGLTVMLLKPGGAEQLKFGQAFNITWAVAQAFENQIVGFDLFLSTNGGATFNVPIAFNNPFTPALGAAVRSFNWTVPSDCVDHGRVLLSATTLSGSKTLDSSATDFTITGNGPTIDANGFSFNSDQTRLKIKTTAPSGGTEIVFSDDVQVELTNGSGQFFAFSKLKKKASHKKVVTKGLINGQSLSSFFPDQAVRILRITNPPCDITKITIKRNGTEVIPVAASRSRVEWP